MTAPIKLDAVATHARCTPRALAMVDAEERRRWTYADLDRAVDRLAAWLTGRLGPASGSRVATLVRNCPDMVVLHLACARAGAIFVPLNWRLAADEIAALVADAAPALLFNDVDFQPPAGPAALPIATLLEQGEDGARPDPSAARTFEDVATLLYTSGTSGRPKGVMLSEANIFWSVTNFNHGNAVTANSVFLCDMPLFHTAGLITAVRAPLQAGGCAIVSRGFDPARTLARLTNPTRRVTHYFSVPQMAATLWNQPGFDPSALRHLVAWTVGGAPNPRAQTERFVSAGIALVEGFGMTETGSNFGMPPGDFDRMVEKAGSCGLPFVAIEARTVDRTGIEVPAGEHGELVLRGPSVTRGYWNQPDASAAAFDDDGWFRTGDVAICDADGFVTIVDRHKDMYISGGENVYPAEVEAVLGELADIAEVAVVGVPDLRWGEVGRAYVVPADGRTVAIEAALDHCRRRLARYKVPAILVLTDAVPRTASGKVQKHLLRLRAVEEMRVDED